MNSLFEFDYYRMIGQKYSGVKKYINLLLRYDLRYLKHLRGNPHSILYKVESFRASRKYGLEILSHTIGPGLYIGHAHNINVHPNVVIGKNCNLNKGCTIGRENRGVRQGAPILGDNCWIGSNAVVVGKIKIGNDVLIAPNAYVNFDVPDHSIVIGNPGIIIYKDNATENYISNPIE